MIVAKSADCVEKFKAKKERRNERARRGQTRMIDDGRQIRVPTNARKNRRGAFSSFCYFFNHPAARGEHNLFCE